mgnify:CR=1 FL=1
MDTTYLDELQSLFNEDIITDADKNVRTITITEDVTRMSFEFNDTELFGTDTTLYKRSQKLYTKLQQNTNNQVKLQRITVYPEKGYCDFKFNHLQPTFDLFPLIEDYLRSRSTEYLPIDDLEIISNGNVKVSFPDPETFLPEEEFRGSEIYSGMGGKLYLTFSAPPTVETIIRKGLEHTIQASPLLSIEDFVVTFLCYREYFDSLDDYVFEFELSSKTTMPKTWLK